jgi:hypothetical protein
MNIGRMFRIAKERLAHGRKKRSRGAGGGGPVMLAAGTYWQAGLKSSGPYEGEGWTAGLPGLSDGESITVLVVQASAARTSAPTTVTYKGSLTVATGQSWTGAAWANLAGWSAGLFPAHVFAWTSETASHTFTSTASEAYLFQYTEDDTSGGFMQADAQSVS